MRICSAILVAVLCTAARADAQEIRVAARRGLDGQTDLDTPAGLAFGVDLRKAGFALELGYATARDAADRQETTCSSYGLLMCDDPVQEPVRTHASEHAFEAALLFFPVRSTLELGAGVGASIDLYRERRDGLDTRREHAAEATGGASLRFLLRAAARLDRIPVVPFADVQFKAGRATPCPTDIYNAQCGETQLLELRAGLSYRFR